MSTFEIMAKGNPNDLESGYGAAEAENARTLIIDIVKGLGDYHIDSDVTQITVCNDDIELFASAFLSNDGSWELHEYDADGNDSVFAATTVDSYGDAITIRKTDDKVLYDGIECPLWIHDEGNMVTYYCEHNGEFVDTTNNYHCDVKSDAYELVANAHGSVSSVELDPNRGYVVDGVVFEHLADALREARSK